MSPSRAHPHIQPYPPHIPPLPLAPEQLQLTGLFDTGSLYVSQYRCRGVLRFDADQSGSRYKYSSVVASRPELESPEGLVVCHDWIYVVSAAHGTVNQVCLKTGKRVLPCPVSSSGSAYVPRHCRFFLLK